MMELTTPVGTSSQDFVVMGEAAIGSNGNVRLQSALLNHNPTRARVKPVVICSNYAKAQDFYLLHATGTLCSAALTSADLLWMERTSGLKAGALFKAFKQATSTDPPSVCGPVKSDLEPMMKITASRS